MPKLSVLSVLATAFLAGEATVEQITARATETLGRPWRWIHPVAARYIEEYAGRTRPRHREVVQFLLHDRSFIRAWAKHSTALSIQKWLTEAPVMQPVAAAGGWPVPAIESAAALAAWLFLELRELAWYADLKGLTNGVENHPRLQHYRYRIVAKQSGGVRLIEAPKPLLKELQRQILGQILDRIPPHPAVHGFVKGRSIRTFVAPHTGQRAVLRMDLQNFFPSISGARIQTFFRTVGYPESVADLLGGICTNAAPRAVRSQLQEARGLYARPHLPQGAPTSPSLANLCAWRADCRLAGLAKSAGARYTRYADDMAFSGGESFDRRADRFSAHVAAILHEEGFTVNHRKTRVMRQGVRQHLAGLVANRHLNVVRADFDRLKATLTNCIRAGAESQNRDAHPSFRSHLDGRVGFVETINPRKGQRLRELFEQIEWK